MLVLAIGGCTVAELRQRMSVAEYMRWMEFYQRNPFDDLHRYQKPAAFVAQSMAGGDFEEKITFLRGEIVSDKEQVLSLDDEVAMWSKALGGD